MTIIILPPKGPRASTTLDCNDLVVSLKGAIELDLDIEADPDFIAVLEIDLDSPLRKEQIDIDDNAVLQVSGYGSEADTENTNGDGEREGRGINISRDLFASSAEVRGSFISGQSSQYPDWPKAPINVHSCVWLSGEWRRAA